MPISLTYPARGWAQVYCDPVSLADMARVALDDLRGIPGVKVGPAGVTMHWSTWMLAPVAALFAAVGAQPQALQTVETVAEDFEGLYQHQIDGMKWMLQYPGVILGDNMGLGKTASAICAAEAYDPEQTRPRVIVGPKFTRNVWERELLRVGAIEDASREFCAIEGRNPDAENINMDALWYFAHYDVIEAWWSRISRRRPLVGIADEAHYAKNPNTRRSKGMAMALGGTPFRMLLTGTPIMTRASDLWHLLNVAGGAQSFGSSFEYKQRYCGMQHDGQHYVEGAPSNELELQHRLKSIYLRRTAETAGLNMPPLTRQTIETDLSRLDSEAHSARMHGIDPQELYEALVSGRGGQDTLTLLNELRKITSASKVPATVEYVSSAVEQGEHVVVFTWERATSELLASRIRTHTDGAPVSYVHGGLTQRERDHYLDQFQGSQTPGVLVATYDALGVGVTLTRARMVVLHDLGWTPSVLLQAEARIHRIGSTQACIATWMLAKNSIDTLFARLLARKAQDTSVVLGMLDGTKAVLDTGLDALADDAFEAEVRRLVGV